jgi:hypothetical protein
MSGIELPQSMFSDTLAKVLEQKVEELRLVDAKTAGQMLSMTDRGFRELAKREGVDHFDMAGERRTRWSLADIRSLINKRRVLSS